MASHDPPSESGRLSDSSHSVGSNGNGSGIGHGSGVGHGSGHGMLAPLDARTPALSAPGWLPAPPRRPEILSAKANPVELLHALRRRWTLAVGLSVLFSGLVAGLLWYLIPVQYEAFSMLRVASKAPKVFETGGGGAEEFATFKRTQLQLILSNAVLRRTLNETEIGKLESVKEHYDDPVAWLKGKLIIDYPDDSEILRVAIKTKKPSDSIKIVNKVVEKYLSEIVARDRDERHSHEKKLSDTYGIYLDDCKKQEESLFKMQLINKTPSTEAARIEEALGA